MADQLTVDLANGIRECPIEKLVSERIVTANNLAGYTAVVVAETGNGDLYIANVYDPSKHRDDQHVGCVEDDGSSCRFYPGCFGKDSASFDEGGWAHQDDEAAAD